jgi:hypothetical protein
MIHQHVFHSSSCNPDADIAVNSPQKKRIAHQKTSVTGPTPSYIKSVLDIPLRWVKQPEREADHRRRSKNARSVETESNLEMELRHRDNFGYILEYVYTQNSSGVVVSRL